MLLGLSLGLWLHAPPPHSRRKTLGLLDHCDLRVLQEALHEVIIAVGVIKDWLLQQVKLKLVSH